MHLHITHAVGTKAAVIAEILSQAEAIKSAIAANIADSKQPKPDTTIEQLDAVVALATAEINAVQSTGVNIPVCQCIIDGNGVRCVQINIIPINLLV